MVDRVLWGRRSNGEIGFFVSRPGYDVDTANSQNLMLSLGAQTLQIVQSGALSVSTAEQALNLPNLGFKPFVILNCARFQVGLRYASNTLAYYRRFSDRGAGLNDTLYYQVTNVPWS